MTILENDQTGLPDRVFCVVGKGGTAINAAGDAVGRLVGLAVRYGVPLSGISAQLIGITHEESLILGHDAKSMPEAVGLRLKEVDASAHPGDGSSP